MIPQKEHLLIYYLLANAHYLIIINMQKLYIYIYKYIYIYIFHFWKKNRCIIQSLRVKRKAMFYFPQKFNRCSTFPTKLI